MSKLNFLTPNLTMDEVQTIVFCDSASMFHCNDIGETPLHLQDDHDVVLFLLEQGADPKAETCTKNTPLHYKKDPRVVDLLLKWGADPNSINSFGNTPLHKQTDKESVKLLMKVGADIKIKNVYDKIPYDVNSNAPRSMIICYTIIFVVMMAWIITTNF